MILDNNTLNGLIEAYEAAPSVPLSKMIGLAYIQRGDIDSALGYIEQAGGSFDDEELISVGETLLTAGRPEEVVRLLDVSSAKSSVLVSRAQVALGNEAEAKALYLDAIRKDVSVQDEDLNLLWDISAAEEAGEPRKRLRVIEKTESADVVDINRFRTETTDFNDVVGLEKIKKQIHKKIILPFQKPSLFTRFRKKVGGGVLLFGPPGCGKTLLARATAGECNASFFNIEISDVLDMYIGESERKLSAIFEKAREEKPSVIFFDEIEALAGKREFSRNSASNNVISQMLTELDGFSQNNEGVLVLASTNVPWAIDPAFLRPGRFDRMFFVPPPDKVARTGILRHHMKKRPATNDINFEMLAGKTSGFSGADLTNLVEMAADEAIDASIEAGVETPISHAHFREALQESRSTTIEWLTTARNYARYANDGGRYNDVIDFLKKHGK